MIIRAINRKQAPPKQSALRRFVTTPTSCKGCGAVRRLVGKVTGIKAPAR